LLKYLRNSRSKSFPLLLILTLLLLTISGFNKSYVPVITKDASSSVVEGCHEQINFSALKKLVQNVFENSEEKDCCENICICCSTNLRGNLKFILAESSFIYSNQKTRLLKKSGKLNLNQYKIDSYNNKSPPYLLS